QEVDRSTMTAQVAHLEGRHLVERTPDPADRRAVAVSITEAGRETLARHEDEIAEVLADLFQDWAEDDLGDLAVRLGRLADTIEARSGSGEG
ncbi:MAG: MarR family winged helix-turn-helix transcriptional regulator, partial [Actinomycetaceae bacterium]